MNKKLRKMVILLVMVIGVVAGLISYNKPEEYISTFDSKNIKSYTMEDLKIDSSTIQSKRTLNQHRGK